MTRSQSENQPATQVAIPKVYIVKLDDDTELRLIADVFVQNPLLKTKIVTKDRPDTVYPQLRQLIEQLGSDQQNQVPGNMSFDFDMNWDEKELKCFIRVQEIRNNIGSTVGSCIEVRRKSGDFMAFHQLFLQLRAEF